MENNQGFSAMSWLFLAISIYLCVAVNAQELDTETTLDCRKDSMRVVLSKRFISKLKIDVTDSSQLYFNGYPECFANVDQDGYSITLYPPYNVCGTRVQPGADVYSYFNEIVYQSEDTKILIYKFRCDYVKKYVVSSDLSLTPVVRTLNIVTARGEFSVGMSLYQRRDFNPKSMFSLKPTVLVGTPVYVSVDMMDVFGKKEIVTTIETCYATDDKDHSIQNLYHSLIVNRCSSPEDDTVKIISNGDEMSARFEFQMFSWRKNVEYFYLHCEIKVCNTTEERCSGVGPVCAGIHEDDVTSRRKRDIEPDNPGSKDIVLGNKGLVSYGPVQVQEKGEEDLVGQGSFEIVFEELEKDQKFLRVYIYVSVAAVVLLAGAIVITIVIVRKTRAGRRKKLNNSISSTESL